MSDLSEAIKRAQARLDAVPQEKRERLYHIILREELQRELTMSEHLKRYAQYVRNTGKSPLPAAMFDEDWEPAGPMLRRQMAEAGLIEEYAGALMLTGKGEALL